MQSPVYGRLAYESWMDLHLMVPVIESSTYRSPWYCRSPHWQTIFPNVTRRRIRVAYRRERLELSDGDFVDVDWVRSSRKDERTRCCLILHGLEGDSQAPYVKALARSFDRAGYAVGALNLRGCSGEPNRSKSFYHSGDTLGLKETIERLAERFDSLFPIGFSLGGNVVLKYLGEERGSVPEAVRGAVAYSVPCDLAGAAERLASPENAFYMKRFIRMLCAKLEAKTRVYPQYRYQAGCSEMKDFHDFDGTYTAPLNGFADAQDYWTRCSSARFLDSIDRPALLINASNDPFLSPSCFPLDAARSSDRFFLESPETGGHCGFPGAYQKGGYWHERRALEFFDSIDSNTPFA